MAGGEEQFYSVSSITRKLHMGASYMACQKKADQDLEAGRQCIHYAALSSWWDWDAGSCTFFWRWPLQ
eukprot:12123858-Ditylum_brightwellii.AAC.1